MKQKVVIRVCLNQKSRPKVLKLIVSFEGIESAKWGGKEGDQIEVVGDGIDAVNIISLLRKKIGSADVVSVSLVEEGKGKDKDGQKKEKKSDTEPITGIQGPVWSAYPIHHYANSTPCYAHFYPSQPAGYCDSSCSIM